MPGQFSCSLSRAGLLVFIGFCVRGGLDFAFQMKIDSFLRGHLATHDFLKDSLNGRLRGRSSTDQMRHTGDSFCLDFVCEPDTAPWASVDGLYHKIIMSIPIFMYRSSLTEMLENRVYPPGMHSRSIDHVEWLLHGQLV